MIPAKAPMGVRNAPMLLPMMLANTAWVYALPSSPESKEENQMLIGMLLMRLEAKKEEYP